MYTYLGTSDRYLYRLTATIYNKYSTFYFVPKSQLIIMYVLHSIRIRKS